MRKQNSGMLKHVRTSLRKQKAGMYAMYPVHIVLRAPKTPSPVTVFTHPDKTS